MFKPTTCPIKLVIYSCLQQTKQVIALVWLNLRYLQNNEPYRQKAAVVNNLFIYDQTNPLTGTDLYIHCAQIFTICLLSINWTHNKRFTASLLVMRFLLCIAQVHDTIYRPNTDNSSHTDTVASYWISDTQCTSSHAWRSVRHTSLLESIKDCF